MDKKIKVSLDEIDNIDNKLAVDIVRAYGGLNSKEVLVIYCKNIIEDCSSMIELAKGIVTKLEEANEQTENITD